MVLLIVKMFLMRFLLLVDAWANTTLDRGQSNIIDAGLDWWEANIEGKTVETVGWKCYNPPDMNMEDILALYTPLAENVHSRWQLYAALK